MHIKNVMKEKDIKFIGHPFRQINFINALLVIDVTFVKNIAFNTFDFSFVISFVPLLTATC